MMVQARKQRRLTPKQAAKCCGPLDELLDPRLFKALCDPTRAKMLGCLAKCGRGCSVGEIGECCSVDLSVVSRHLALLAQAGVVESSKAGRVVTYTVRYATLCRTLRDLADALEGCRGTEDACCKGGSCGAC